MDFDSIAFDGVCDVCKEETKVVSLCSSFGAVSHSYCQKCCILGLEPYDEMVAYIANAGEYPNDINKIYIEEVRHILSHLGISEERFASDVKKYIIDEQLAIKELMKNGKF